jgi:RNA 3'-terminal phosphate cyclase (ATP)
MLTIDGRTGGGQLVRTALSLAAITGTPFEIEAVRGDRPNPGLKPQHLAAVRTIAGLCGAEVEGATADSETFAFVPGQLDATSQAVDIGTAGSVSLLFDTVLPLATRVGAGFDLTATGGTDVKWSPPVGSLERVKLPLLARFGLAAGVDLERTGFYPSGGGRATLHLEPSPLDPIRLEDRGPLERVEVYSKASTDLEDAEVAERQAARTVEALEPRGLRVTPAIEYVESASPGSSLLLRAVYRDSLAGFDALGERGKPSEAVADEAVEAFLAFHRSNAAVDVYLADQLVGFLALAGGRVAAPRASDHVRSHVELVGRFGFEVDLEAAGDGTVTIHA